MSTQIRMYTKGEVAALYMPDITSGAARKNLIAWIKNNGELEEELVSAGYTQRAKLLTPKQIRIIFKYLGEP